MLFSCATPWTNFIFTGNSLTQHKFIIFQSCSAEINQVKIKVLSGLHSFWKFEERICVLEFSSFKRLLAFLDSWHFPLFLNPAMADQVLFTRYYSNLTSASVFHFRNPVITLGPPEIIQDNLPILWSAD